MLPSQKGRALRRRVFLLVCIASLLTTIAHYRRVLADTLLHPKAPSQVPAATVDIPDTVPASDQILVENVPKAHRNPPKVLRPAANLSLPKLRGRPNLSEDEAKGEVAVSRRSLEEIFANPHPGEYRDLLDRIRKTVPRSVWGEPAPASIQALANRTGCDILTVPFHPRHDSACRRYLGNVSNWAEVTAMASLFDERTVKFKVRLRDDGLWAILKVTQQMFTQEPYSEYAAWVVDRALQYNRIPPTVWVDNVPLTLLKDALSKDKDPKHVEFVRTEFLDYIERSKLVKRDASGVESLGASVQMWTLDVHHLLDTEFAIPYRAHNGSWHRYFDPAIGYPAELTIPVHHISQLLTFDYIISNNDRSPNKNNYVAGGCKNRRCLRKRKKPWHPGPPDFIYLDHGMGFYHTGTPHDSPLSKHNSPFCLFRRPVIKRLLELESKGDLQPLSNIILPRLPAAVKKQLGVKVLQSCQTRLDHLLSQVRGCLTRWDEDVVLVP